MFLELLASACLTPAEIVTFIHRQIDCSLYILQGVATGKSHCYLNWTVTILEKKKNQFPGFHMLVQ